MTVLKIIRNAQHFPMSAKHVQTKNEVQSGLRALFPCFIAKIYKKTTATKKKKKKKEKKKKKKRTVASWVVLERMVFQRSCT